MGMERRVLFGGFFEVGIAVGAQTTPSSRPRLVFVAEVRDCASCPFGRRLALPCFVHGQASEGAIEDGEGKRAARLRMDAALEAAEDGHVAGLQVRRAVWREEAQHDVRESGLHGGQGGLAGVMLAMSQRRIHACPSLPRLSTSSSVASRRIVVVVAQPLSDVTWRVRSGQDSPSKTASVLPVHDLHSVSSGPRSMLKATVNVVPSFALPCSWACFTPRRPHPI